MTYPMIRDPFSRAQAIFFTGFHQGSFTWAAFTITPGGTRGDRASRINFKSDARWPHLTWISGDLDSLKDGIIVDDNTIATDNLEKALELWAAIVKRRKDRADRSFNQVAIAERALAARDKAGLLACMAEIGA